MQIKTRPAPRHLLYGLWAGWTGVLLLSRTGIIKFAVKTPPDGILGYCFLNGYPKQQDYFWFGAMVVGGFAGVILARLFLSVWPKRAKGVAGGEGFLWAGIVSGTLAVLLGLSAGWGKSPLTWLLYGAGVVLPWLYRGWNSGKNEIPADLPNKRIFPRLGYWTAFSLVISLLWAADSRLHCRMIDGIHEGTQLLYAQSLMEGQKLGIDFKTEYGPLGTLGLSGWMQFAGISIAQERMYFLFMQSLGVAISLMVFRMAGLGWFATGVGTILVLTESSALGVRHGGAIALRTALAFLAIVMYWRGRIGGRGWLVASGIFQATALMYSPDFGMAAGAAILAMVVMDWIGREKPGNLRQFGIWVSSVLAGLAMLSIAIYGQSAVAGISGLLFGGYGGARLMGHGVRPFPVFELLGNWEPLRQIWLIGFISTGAVVWSLFSGAVSNKRTLVLGAGIFTMLALIPGLARPMGQFLFAVPSCVFLVAVALDIWRNQGGKSRRRALYLGGFLVMLAFGHVYLVLNSLILKYTPCEYTQEVMPDVKSPDRLGGVEPVSMEREDVALAARTIALLSKKGEYVYVGAPAHAHLCFLADRPGLPPYPSGIVAVTSSQRAQALDSLKKLRPPVALLSQMGIDIPYAVEHKEEVEYIKRNYSLVLRTGDLMIYRLVGPQ